MRRFDQLIAKSALLRKCPPHRCDTTPDRSADTFAAMRSIFLFCLFMATIANAQTDPKVFVPYSQQKPTQTVVKPAVAQAQAIAPATDDSGQVVIHESARIQALMKDYAAAKQPLKGYRVQIFLGDRTKAEETRRSFLVKHPDTPAYLDYLAPNFRVRVGDLRSKLEGEKLKQKLTTEFPGLYVVPCEIELPRLPEEK